jgi:hypothetical protein
MMPFSGRCTPSGLVDNADNDLRLGNLPTANRDTGDAAMGVDGGP